jgi:hypothetical protein
MIFFCANDGEEDEEEDNRRDVLGMAWFGLKKLVFVSSWIGRVVVSFFIRASDEV